MVELDFLHYLRIVRYSLENHFAVHAGDMQHAFVAKHARAVNLNHGAQEILQFGRAEGLAGFVNE